MAYLPIFWNRMNHDIGDLFNAVDTDFEPMGLSYGRPMGMIRYGGRRRPETSLADKKWSNSIKIGDFDPQHVKVKVENGKVIIHAKYSEGDDEWGDSMERKRTVQLPDNVDAEKIHSYMKSDGTMMLEAPYIKSEEKKLAVVPSEGGTLVPSDGHRNLMKFDVGNFKPEEVKISCKDGILTAQGERQKTEDGHELREYFSRQMTVPRSVDAKNIECFRDEDGNLTIRAPNKEDVAME